MFKTWGTEPWERELEFPCDLYGGNFSDAYFRGITIRAEPETIFPWHCQMKVAPYSYDWIDNLGRKSPRYIIPGRDRLAMGQKFMFIFDQVDFQQNRHLTLRVDKRFRKLFGDTLISYIIVRQQPNLSRLLAKILIKYPRGPLGILVKTLLPPGDLIMMRKQFINFRNLSETPLAGKG